MSQAPPPRERQRHQPKPPRLRSACNQCNTAKVKCSGEHNGCTRCKNMRTQCVYTESRVGKVQGPRTRRKRSEVIRVATGIPSQMAPPVAQFAEDPPFTSPAQSPSSHASDTVGQNMELWPESAWQADFLMVDNAFSPIDNLLEGNAETVQSSSSAGSGDYSASDTMPTTPKRSLMDYEFALPGSDTQTCTTQGETGQSNWDVRPIDQSFAEINSKCVLACVHIVATLENYLLSKLRALDLIFEAIRKAANELKKLIQLQQASRCDRCINLFTTVIMQIIELLELGVGRSRDNEADASDSVLSSLQTEFMPGFGLGALAFSAEEQRLWRSRIVRREYAQVEETLSSLIALARLGPHGTATSLDVAERRTRGLTDLQRRLKALTEKENVGGC